MWRMNVCVCNRYPGCVIWLNYEVVGFQPWSGITEALDYVAYCCVTISCLPWYSSHWLSHRMQASAHLIIVRLLPNISSHCTSSYVHLGVARLLPRISDFLLFCPRFYLQTLLCVPLSPFPSLRFPQYFIQSCPKLCFRRLFMPIGVPYCILPHHSPSFLRTPNALVRCL